MDLKYVEILVRNYHLPKDLTVIQQSKKMSPNEIENECDIRTFQFFLQWRSTVELTILQSKSFRENDCL